MIFGAIDIILWMVDSFVQGARDVWKEIAIQKQLNAVRRDIIEPLTEISYSDFEKIVRKIIIRG